MHLSTETSALRRSGLSTVVRNGSISRVVLSQTLFALHFEESRGRLLARQAPMALVNAITILRNEETASRKFTERALFCSRIRDEMKLNGYEPLWQLRQYCLPARDLILIPSPYSFLGRS